MKKVLITFWNKYLIYNFSTSLKSYISKFSLIQLPTTIFTAQYIYKNFILSGLSRTLITLCVIIDKNFVDINKIKLSQLE